MKRWYFLLYSILSVWWLPGGANGQGDWAVYDTFTRFSPAVYSLSIELPQQYILTQHEELIKQILDLQEKYSDIIAGSSDPVSGQAMLSNLIRQLWRKLDVMRDRLLSTNYIRCVGFAVGPHHLVTTNNMVKSATLGSAINIEDDFHRRLAQAEWIGSDDLTGVSVLRVNDVTFTHFVNLNEYFIPSEDYNQPQPHETNPLPVASYIMTIQRPYEFPSSPFSGIIGGYNRMLGLTEIEKYIQTDLPLYPGNEGAPVFSPSGQLVGMMAVELHMGNGPGMTFVIPSDIVADSALAIMESGKRERGWISGLGIGQDINGIVVEEVIPHSPAAMAGLQKGDLILGFNGSREKRVWNLIDFISRSKPDAIIRFEIMRGSQLQWIDIKTSLRLNRK